MFDAATMVGFAVALFLSDPIEVVAHGEHYVSRQDVGVLLNSPHGGHFAKQRVGLRQ
jgi:hypothetical protein